MRKINKRKVGTEYENVAVNYLINHGHRLIERNFRCILGEIDIITFQNDTLVFSEVKYRSAMRYGYPTEAVDLKKQNVIKKTAQFFIKQKMISDTVKIRFDVISILGKEIQIIENAFSII